MVFSFYIVCTWKSSEIEFWFTSLVIALFLVVLISWIKFSSSKKVTLYNYAQVKYILQTLELFNHFYFNSLDIGT